MLFKILCRRDGTGFRYLQMGSNYNSGLLPEGQHRSEFDNDYSIVDWLTQYSEEKDATYVRGFLGRMLFSGEDGVKKVRVLSGGEKVRCLLSKMMIAEPTY